MYFLCFYLSLFDAKALKSMQVEVKGSKGMLTPLLISYQFHRTVISLPYTLKVIIHSQYDLGFRMELIMKQVI